MDIEQIRKDTPDCSDKLFLNSAGSSLTPKIVNAKVLDYLLAEEKLGGYKVAEVRQPEINTFYEEAATLINCRAENIAFTSSATDAYAKALSAIHFKPNDVILTTDDDYVSNHLHFISLQKRFGVNVIRGKNLENGEIDIVDFESLILNNNPKLVAVTHIPTNSGLIQNAEAIGDLCEKHKIVYLVDACQSIGQIEVDVKKLKCDFLSVTGRKFLRGPRGIGFLFVSDNALKSGHTPLFIDLRGATWTGVNQYDVLDNAKRFEMWEVPYALLIGFTEAIRYANHIGIKNIETYNQQITSRLSKNLCSIPGVTVYDKGLKKGSIITFKKANKSLKETQTILDTHNVYYSVSQKSNALIDFDKKGVDWAIRLSPHYFNTREEIDKVAEIIENL